MNKTSEIMLKNKIKKDSQKKLEEHVEEFDLWPINMQKTFI
jgi:hypothetical protein